MESKKRKLYELTATMAALEFGAFYVDGAGQAHVRDDPALIRRTLVGVMARLEDSLYMAPENKACFREVLANLLQ